MHYVLTNIDTCLISDLNYAPQRLGLTPSFVFALSCTARGMSTTIVRFDKTLVARYNQGVDEDTNKNVLQIVTANISPPRGDMCRYISTKVLQD